MADTSKRGFASMDEDKQREIASKGGKAAHEKGTAHEFTPEEAREAGRKGGEAVSRDREHMAEIGREGGKKSHKRDNEQEEDTGEERNEGKTRGGTSEQHAEAGRQSHKNK
ncbi:KGG domain-containing protein [Pannus brasiliensis CCIBt3594]|uniref:KGG domain-containing protein n=1 Tax=Pannus brasiliensis CCIBt3594 TaxID=1427578 RepID=A0AAW9QVN9_9CHRO